MVDATRISINLFKNKRSYWVVHPNKVGPYHVINGANGSTPISGVMVILLITGRGPS